MNRINNRAKDFLFNPLLDGFWLDRLRGTVTCLLYHRVDDPTANSFLTQARLPVITSEELGRHLRFLIKRGVFFYTFKDLREGKFPHDSEVGFIISFDDCFLDNYTNGLEILEKLTVKAVFFQSTAMIDAQELLWEHALYWYARNPEAALAFTHLVHGMLRDDREVRSRSGIELVEYLREEVPVAWVEGILEVAKLKLGTEKQLAELAVRLYPTSRHIQNAYRLGHEIGSHGHHHYKRRNIDQALFEKELADSSSMLQAVLGERPEAFSYPFNSYHPGDGSICARYFAQTVTVNGMRILRQTDPLHLPRFTWPGPTHNSFRNRRWLLSGTA